MILLSEQDKLDYENLITDAFLNAFASKQLKWVKSKNVVQRFGEDTTGELDSDNPIFLPCLINYNYLRSWPITAYTDTGEVDKQSMQILLSKKYLQDTGFLTSDGYWQYSPAFDRFYIDGMELKASGDTAASQAFNDDIFITIIMIRTLKDTRDT